MQSLLYRYPVKCPGNKKRRSTTIVFALYGFLHELNEMELSIASILFSPVSDFIFYFLHGVILHGPLWSFHRGHHQIYKPTTTSGRDFDALDWFLEFTIPVIVRKLLFWTQQSQLDFLSSSYHVSSWSSTGIIFISFSLQIRKTDLGNTWIFLLFKRSRCMASVSFPFEN